MTVYTESGSMYSFTLYDGTLRTLYGNREMVVENLKNLKVGSRLTVEGYTLNMYCQQSKELSFFTTSPIVKIEM